MHRRQTLAALLTVAAIAAGTCSATADAQDQRRGGSAEELWEEYPLDPEGEPPRRSEPRTETRPEPRTETRPEPRTETRPEPRTETQPEPRTETQPEPRDGRPVTPGAGDEFESEARAPQAPPTPFAMVIVVALAVPGLALALLALEFRGRGRRLDLPRGATARFRQRAKAGVRAALARSAASDATAPPAHAEADATDGKAPAPTAHATGPDGPEPLGPASTAASPEGGSAGPGATEPLESGLPAASPPDPGRPWTAEIDWGNDAGVWSFTIVASSGGEDARAIVMSAPVQWPPASPAAVQSLIDTVDALASSLTAAGWTPLPPGEPWYARRFAWHPVAVAPPASAPGDGTTSTGILEPPAQGARTAVTR